MLTRVLHNLSVGKSFNLTFPKHSGYPPAGSYNSTTNLDYVQGSYSVIQSVTYYAQTADYIVKNDGAGGTYVDFYTASNIQYKTGSFLSTTNESHDGGYVTLPYGLGGGNTANYAGYNYIWNGSGGYTQTDNYVNYAFTGQIGANDYVNSSMSAGYYNTQVGGSYFPNGKYTYYSINGAESYYGNDNQGNYYSYSTYIYNDGMNTYYWDGNGGYYFY